ncbi:MAG: hypothetical protein Q7J56_01115 [Deltaproteobacteria bacterium]|nr:hypothetical protein [Deltaproteobacteria bacterium]
MAKISKIAGEQSCLSGQCDRGNLKIHGAKPNTGAPQLRQSFRSRVVEIKHRSLCEKRKQRMKLTIAHDLLFNSLRASDHSQPAAHLFFDIHDGCANIAGRHAAEASGQDEKVQIERVA